MTFKWALFDTLYFLLNLCVIGFFFGIDEIEPEWKKSKKKKKCWNPSLKMPIIFVSHLRYLFPKHSSISAFVFFFLLSASSLYLLSSSISLFVYLFSYFVIYSILLLESFCIFVLFFFSNFSLKSKENSRHRREHNNKNRFDTHIIVMIGVQWFINDQIDWIMLHRFFFSSFQYVSSVSCKTFIR